MFKTACAILILSNTFNIVMDAAREITPWAENLRVTSRGYMLGYQSLRDPSVSGFFRLLAKIGDGAMKMQIVRIEFK